MLRPPTTTVEKDRKCIEIASLGNWKLLCILALMQTMALSLNFIGTLKLSFLTIFA